MEKETKREKDKKDCYIPTEIEIITIPAEKGFCASPEGLQFEETQDW